MIYFIHPLQYNVYHYAIKEKIIKGIKEFLALDCEYNYDDIFDGLVKLKKLVEVKKSYNKISVYHTERKENA